SRNLPAQIDVQHDIRRRAHGKILVHAELDDRAATDLAPAAERQLHAGFAELPQRRIVERTVQLDLRLEPGPRPRLQAAADDAEHARAARIIADVVGLAEPHAADSDEVACRQTPDARRSE